MAEESPVSRRTLPPLTPDSKSSGVRKKKKKHRPEEQNIEDIAQSTNHRRKSRTRNRSASKERVVSSSPEERLVVGTDNPNLNNNSSVLSAGSSPSPKRTKAKSRKKSREGSVRSLRSGSQSGHRSAGQESSVADLSGRNSEESTTRRKKKKRKVSSVEDGRVESLGLNLADIKDDIVVPDVDADTEAMQGHTLTGKVTMKSQPSGKLYIEQTRGFKVVPGLVPGRRKFVNKPTLSASNKKYLHLKGEYEKITDWDSAFDRRVSMQLIALQATRRRFSYPTPSQADLRLSPIYEGLHHIPLNELLAPFSRDILPDISTASRGFKPAEKRKMDELYADEKRQNAIAEDDEADFPDKMTALTFALQSHHVFKTFSQFCMGILAGIALWQTVFVYWFTGGWRGYDSFLSLYGDMSIPINCIFYIIMVFSTVAVFDRYDIAKVDKQFMLQSCTLQSGTVAAVFYLAALCVNVSMMSWDDRLSAHTNATFNSTDYYESISTTLDWESAKARDVSTWKILSVLRCILVLLGWFIVSLRPQTDRFLKNMHITETIK